MEDRFQQALCRPMPDVTFHNWWGREWEGVGVGGGNADKNGLSL